jgi:mannitol/fructose-specific phosphotransferase system IIA component (Ntr-type)
MQPTLNHLLQLQELTVARAQQAASMPGARLSELDASVDALLRDLPDPIANQFRRLAKKDLLVLAPVSNSVCAACGIALPVSMVQAVRMADALRHCPNCARILYCPEVPLRGRVQRPSRRNPVKTGVSRFSTPGLMVPRLSAAGRDEAVAELCQKLEQEGFMDDASVLIEAALRREAIAGTAVDHGLAFPHVRGVEGGGLTLALGLSRKGIAFGGPGRTLTRVIFFMVIPTAASAFYLRLLAGLTQAFRDKDRVRALLKTETSEELWKALLRATRSTVR